MKPETEALAGFLSAVDFTHFCTFTTKKPTSVAGMRRVAERVAKYVDAGGASTMFWAAEKFDSTDGMKSTAVLKFPGDAHKQDYTTSRYHFHALMRTHLHAMDIFGWYQGRYGRCQIINNADPDRRHSAAHYCAKYITKSLADYDVYFSKEIKTRSQTDFHRFLGAYDRFPTG